jgi:AcrR family transcriptional regulator
MESNAIVKAGQSLTAKQERAVLALLEHSTMEEAAKAVGVGKTTLWRWLQDKDFHAAYMKARRESVKQSIARLQKYTSEAADTLHEVMTNKSANDFARVGAAKAILDYAIKAVEVEDLAARVAELESILKPKPEEGTK